MPAQTLNFIAIMNLIKNSKNMENMSSDKEYTNANLVKFMDSLKVTQ